MFVVERDGFNGKTMTLYLSMLIAVSVIMATYGYVKKIHVIYGKEFQLGII